jgi:glycerol-3-phosphate dehydrogenase
MRVRSDGPQLISQLITKYLAIDCSVLMGANIAGDIGREQLSEAVIGYSNPEHAKVIGVRPLLPLLCNTPPVHAAWQQHACVTQSQASACIH